MTRRPNRTAAKKRAALLIAAPLFAFLAGAPVWAAMPAEEGYSVRAQLRSRNFTTLAAGVAGELIRMPVREGDSIAAGTLIAATDCSAQLAGRKISEAKLSAAIAKARTADRLAQLNSASVLEQELAKAEVAQINAELAAMDAALKKCDIRAPFAGVIVAQMARPHQYLREGEPLIELVDISNMEVELIVPSRWLEWVKPGLGFTLQVDELGRSVKASIDKVAGKVDPVSQTIRLLGRIEAAGQRDLLPGMSGTARFDRIPVSGPK